MSNRYVNQHVDDAEVIRLYLTGEYSFREIGELVGCSDDSVRRRIHKAGVYQPNLRLTRRHQKYHKAFEANRSDASIAAEFGVDVKYVNYRRMLHGFRDKRGGWGPRIDDERVKVLTEQGMTEKQIADILGFDRRTVGRSRKRQGIAPGSSNGNRRYTPEQIRRVEEMLDEGHSKRDIERTLGVNWNWLVKRYPGRGWTPAETGQYNRMRKQLDSL